MNRNALKTLSTTNIADAPPLNITAADVRQVNDEVIDSNAVVIDDNPYYGTNIFNDFVEVLKRVDTAYTGPLSSMETVDLTNTGNFVWISGTPDTIKYFGNSPAGAIRFLKFYDACQIGMEGINTITQTLINVEAGDTCIVVSDGGNYWTMVAYARWSGLPTNSASAGKIWTWATNAPTLNDDSNFGFLKDYRWISLQSSSLLREWICDNDSYATAIWNPMAGTVGQWGDGKDLELDYINNNFGGGGSLTYDIRYWRVNNYIYFMGWFDVSQTNGQSGFIEILYNPTTQGITIDTSSVSGFGTLWVNGIAEAENKFNVSVYDTKVYATTSVTFSSPASYRIWAKWSAKVTN